MFIGTTRLVKTVKVVRQSIKAMTKLAWDVREAETRQEVEAGKGRAQKRLELRISFAHTNIHTHVVIQTHSTGAGHALMICEQESIVTSPMYMLDLSLYIDCDSVNHCLSLYRL